jgi:hypothetical protein
MLTEHVRLSGFDSIEVPLAGDTDYHGVRLLAHRIETALLWVLGLRPRAHRGEGICTFLVATAA